MTDFTEDTDQDAIAAFDAYEKLTREDQHRDDCPKPGYRYAATVRSTKANIEKGTAGKVVMICKACPATFLA